MPKKLLDLFTGSGSMAKAARKLGMQTFTTDKEPYEGVDYVVDIMKFDPSQVPFIPDILCAGPPCQGFSVAVIGRNWHRWKDKKGKIHFRPKTESAKIGLRLVEKTIEIIDYYLELNPNLLWEMENPRGMLRKLAPVQDLPIHHTITYCQYGDERMKPTDIWTNNEKWVPRPACKNGMACHVAAPRGSRTGTQGMKNAFERGKYPEDFCMAFLKSCMAVADQAELIFDKH